MQEETDEPYTDRTGKLVEFVEREYKKSGEILLAVVINCQDNSSRTVDALARLAVYAGRRGGRIRAARAPVSYRGKGYEVLFSFWDSEQFGKFYDDLRQAMPSITEHY